MQAVFITRKLLQVEESLINQISHLVEVEVNALNKQEK
jgi:hypothetical protein